MWEAKVKIGSIVVRCYRFDSMVAFWQEVLGYEPREPPKEDGWVVLCDPEGRGPNLSLESLGQTSRVHLDLHTTDQERGFSSVFGRTSHPRIPTEWRDALATLSVLKLNDPKPSKRLGEQREVYGSGVVHSCRRFGL